jgi:hypothetical protein
MTNGRVRLEKQSIDVTSLNAMKSAMNIQKILASISLLGMVVSPAYAIDTWSTTKGVLNMPLVQYGTKTYQNVTAVLGGVISVGSTCSSTSTAADTLSSSTGQLSIPAVTVTTGTGPVTYCNAQVWLSSITSVGGVCADTASCSKYFTPVQFASTLPKSYSPTLTLAGSLTNRARYLVSDSASTGTSANYMTIGNSYSATSPTAGYALGSGTIPLSSTYKTYLSKLIQVVQVYSSGTAATVYDTSGKTLVGWRLDSHLHPLESLDVDQADGMKLKFRRNQGGPGLPTDGYVVFSYNTSTHVLQAVKRYLRSVATLTGNAACTKPPCYNSTFAEDTAFTGLNYYVNYSNGVYSLVASAGSATPLYFYSSADGYTVPSTMNPTLTAYSNVNPDWAFPSGTTTSGTEANFANKLTQQVYKDQVSVGGVTTPGANATTKAAADSYLQTIKTQVESQGEHLRYDPAVYTAFRDALLAGTLASDGVADGTPNQRLVPFVYFTNTLGADSKYHPFMVIITYAQAGGPQGLQDVPVPPGAPGSSTPVSMTRYANLTGGTTRIPMKDYGLVTTANFNTVNAVKPAPSRWDSTLCNDVASCLNGTSSVPDVFNWASTADNGILVDGSQIFPILNNALTPSNWKAELTTYGCHIGQGGGGAHCHADGFVTGQANRLTVYNDGDYVGRTHPPLIGFGYDGVALFGQYRPQDSSFLGAGVPLDEFGGHDHDGMGYHYHAHIGDMPVTPNVYTYTANSKTICSSLDSGCTGAGKVPTKVPVLVQGAWRGNISNVPFFMDNTSTGAKPFTGQ